MPNLDGVASDPKPRPRFGSVNRGDPRVDGAASGPKPRPRFARSGVQRSRWLTMASITGAATALVLGASTCTAPDTEAAARAKADALGNAMAAATRRAPRVDPAATLRGDGVSRERRGSGAAVAQIARAFPSAVHAVAGARFEARLAGVAAMLPAAASRQGPRSRARRASAPRKRRRVDRGRDERRRDLVRAHDGPGRPRRGRARAQRERRRHALYARAFGGADVLVVPRPSGAEDLVVFEKRPAAPEVRYEVDVSRVAGVHQVGRALEFVDAHGVPRLRMNPPFVVGADGARRAATVDVTGCDVDQKPGPRVAPRAHAAAIGAVHRARRVERGGPRVPGRARPGLAEQHQPG